MVGMVNYSNKGKQIPLKIVRSLKVQKLENLDKKKHFMEIHETFI